MKNNKNLFILLSGFMITGIITGSCKKDQIDAPATTPAVVNNGSFTESFQNIGDLTAKGWVFVNNSNPPGSSGWRQGRYESTAQQQYKFIAPVPYLGFQAHSSESSPNEFISADATVVNDATTGTGNISAWLISPAVPVKNGDVITYWTRAMDDRPFAAYAKDRMQIRANYTDASANVGTSDVDTGSFKILLRDINKNYIYNDPAGNTGGAAGFPWVWTKYTDSLNNIPAGVTKIRFAFRYFGRDAGVFGGLGGTNYPTVVGIDDVEFKHQD